MTYVLEKRYELDYSHKLAKAKYLWAIVRPCKEDYIRLKSLFSRDSNGVVILEGQVAQFDADEYSSIEEWLISLNMAKGISPDFENTIIIDDAQDYIVKTVDLRTKTVLYDSIDATIDMIKERYSTATNASKKLTLDTSILYN